MYGGVCQAEGTFTGFQNGHHGVENLEIDKQSWDLPLKNPVTFSDVSELSSRRVQTEKGTQNFWRSDHITRGSGQTELRMEDETVSVYKESCWSSPSEFFDNGASDCKANKETRDASGKRMHPPRDSMIKTNLKVAQDSVISGVRKNKDSASGKYFRLTEDLLITDDFHDLGQEHVAWDPGGRICQLGRPPMYSKSSQLLANVPNDLRCGSEDGDEYEGSSDGESDVTILDNTLDSIVLQEDLQEKYGFETLGNSLMYEGFNGNATEIGQRLNSMDREESINRYEFEDLGDTWLEDQPLDCTLDSVHTLDSLELEDMRKRYGFERFRNAEFKNQSLDDTLDSVHTLDSEELQDMRRRYGFEDMETATPRSESSVHSLDTIGLEELRERYGFERPENLNLYGLNDHVLDDDLNDKLTWNFLTCREDEKEDERFALFTEEDEDLIFSQRSQGHDGQTDYLNPGMSVLLEELNIINGLAPEDTTYDSKNRWTNGIFEARHYEFKPIELAREFDDEESREKGLGVNDTQTIEQLWAKWVESTPMDIHPSETKENVNISQPVNPGAGDIINDETNERINEQESHISNNAIAHSSVANTAETKRDFQKPSSENYKPSDTENVDSYQSSHTVSSEILDGSRGLEDGTSQAKYTLHPCEATSLENQDGQTINIIGVGKTPIPGENVNLPHSEVTKSLKNSCLSTDEDRSRCILALNEAIKDAVISVVDTTPRCHEGSTSTDQVIVPQQDGEGSATYNQLYTPSSVQNKAEYNTHESATLNKQESGIRYRLQGIMADSQDDAIYRKDRNYAKSEVNNDMSLHQIGATSNNQEGTMPCHQAISMSSNKEDVSSHDGHDAEALKLRHDNSSRSQGIPSHQALQQEHTNQELTASEACLKALALENEHAHTKCLSEQTETVSNILTDSCEIQTGTNAFLENRDILTVSRKQQNEKDINKARNEKAIFAADENSRYELSCGGQIALTGNKQMNGVEVQKDNDDKRRTLSALDSPVIEEHASISREICRTETMFVKEYSDQCKDGERLYIAELHQTSKMDSSKQSHQNMCPEQPNTEEPNQSETRTNLNMLGETHKTQAFKETSVNSEEDSRLHDSTVTRSGHTLYQLQAKEDKESNQLNVVALNVAHEILTNILSAKTSKIPPQTQTSRNQSSRKSIKTDFSPPPQETPPKSESVTSETQVLVPRCSGGLDITFTEDEPDGKTSTEDKHAKICSSSKEELLAKDNIQHALQLEEDTNEKFVDTCLSSNLERGEKVTTDSPCKHRVSEYSSSDCPMSGADVHPIRQSHESSEQTQQASPPLEISPAEIIDERHLDGVITNIREIVPVMPARTHRCVAAEKNEPSVEGSDQERQGKLSLKTTDEKVTECISREETSQSINTQIALQNTYQKGMLADFENSETCADKIEEFDKMYPRVNSSNEKKDTSSDANITPDSTYNMFDIAQLQSVATGVVKDVILSSLNKLSMSDTHSLTVHGESEIDLQLMGSSKSSNLSPIAKYDYVSDSSSSDETIRSSQETFKKQLNCSSRDCDDENFQMDLDPANSFSEMQFVHASSPRMNADKSDDSFPDTATFSCSSGTYRTNRAEDDDSGPLTLNDLKPEHIERNADEPKDIAYDANTASKDLFAIAPKVSDVNLEGINVEIVPDREYIQGDNSLSPRYHHYNEGDSGFFDPCDSTASRDDSEINFDHQGVSHHMLENREEHSRVKTSRTRIRTAAVNPGIEEEMEIEAAACEELDENTEIFVEVYQHQKDFKVGKKLPAHGSENVVMAAKPLLTADAAVSSGEVIDAAKVGTNGENSSSTEAEPFYFREKVICTKEDLVSSDNQAEFRSAATGISQYFDKEAESGVFSQDFGEDARQDSHSLNTDFDVQQYDLDQDSKTRLQHTESHQYTRTGVQGTFPSQYTVPVFEHSNRGYDKKNDELPTSDAFQIGSGQDAFTNAQLHSENPNSGIHQADHSLDLQEALDPTSLRINLGPDLQLPGFSHNLRSDLHSSRFSLDSGTYFQPDVPDNNTRERESLPTITETLALDPLSVGLLSPRLSSPRLAPQLTPRSRSNFERLRAMHRQAHGLNTEGLRLGDTGPGHDGSQGSDSATISPQTDSDAVAEQAEAGGGSRDESQDSPCKFLSYTNLIYNSRLLMFLILKRNFSR